MLRSTYIKTDEMGKIQNLTVANLKKPVRRKTYRSKRHPNAKPSAFLLLI